MEYINMAIKIILRWMAVGFGVLYVCSTLSFLCGVLERCKEVHDSSGMLRAMVRSPIAIFNVWGIDKKGTINSIIKWPKTLFDYAGVLYDNFAQLR